MRAIRKASSQVSWSLLTEGVTQSRLEAHRLRLLLDRAVALVESSPERDHLWQVAGDIIQGFPSRLSELERSLDRTSYALVTMGEEFLRGRIGIDDRTVVEEAIKTHPYAEPRKKDESIASRVAQRHMASRKTKFDGAAPSAEHHFFDNPKKRETREFAQTKALSNEIPTAVKAVKEMDNSDVTVSKARSEAKKAPPTPTEIKREPGGKQFSTLNRHVVVTEQPKVKGVPVSREDLPKSEKPKGNL
jgi:hypothetical protein